MRHADWRIAQQKACSASMLSLFFAAFFVAPSAPMTADVPTLLLMIIVTSLVTSGALLVLNGNQRNDGLQYWAGGLLLSALAHALLLLYGRIPYLLAIVLGNALLSSALAGFWLAVRRFHGLALHWARTLAPIAAIAVLMWLFQHQFASRVVVSGFTLSLQAALVLWVLRQRSLGAEQQRSRGALLLVCGLGLIVLTMLLRAGAALFFSLNIASILQSNLVQTLTFMVSFLATLVSSFGFVFMAKERADQANLEVPVSLVDGAIVSSEVLEASLDSDSVVSDRFVEGSVEIVLFSIILHPEKKIDIHNTRITK